MKRALSVAHPWLAAVFPLLFLYTRNQNEIGPGEIVVPLLVVVGSTGTLLLATNILLKDLRRAGLVTSAILLVFFSYGHLWDIFGGQTVGTVTFDKDVYLLLPYASIAFALLALAGRARSSLKEITAILNAIGLTLIAFPAYAIATSGVGPNDHATDCPPPIAASPEKGAVAGQRRDIYYLIFDRYGPASTLKRRFGYDNAPFTDYLRSKGFYVAEQSHANYPRTAHSLASSLNVNFLGCLTKEVGIGSSNYRPIFSTIQDHRVGRFLKDLNYRYYHIGSWATFTATSAIADQSIIYEASRGFTSLVYTTTLARPFGEMLGLSDDRRHSDAKRALFQFRALAGTRTLPGPRFVFSHILLPHEPYLFTRNGRFLSQTAEFKRTLTVNYTEQLQFTNAKIRDLVDSLTSGPTATHPVIVIQSDEGPHPIRFDIEGEDFDWSRATTDELEDTLHVFNAIYLPGVKDPGLYPTITPVNTFRKIFDLYFGANLPPLPDRTYIYRDERHIYDFIDVTDRLRAAASR